VHTVKRAAELTGLSPDTLRAWERRYGVVSPSRSGGGYRLYDDAALRRLSAMKALVDSGWSAAQAARRILAEPATRDPSPGTGSDLADVDALAAAGREMDAARLVRALDEGFAAGSYEQVVDGWLMPALGRLGEAWQSGSVGVAGEHFVSAGVQRRLAGLFDATGQPGPAPVVVVGLARGSRHELGVLAFAVALRRAGLGVVYVGSDLPPEAWVDTVSSRDADAAVIGVPSPDDLPAVRETVQTLRRSCPDVDVLVGGAQQEQVGSGARPLGHTIAGAAGRLAAQLLPDRGGG
jgi:MerR family transcriptional regulator, light-induced transcriptional regulator